MLKLVTIAILLGATVTATPSFADSAGSTIGRGCTLDPFNHTQRCIDFDHCTTNSKGERVCPVVVTSTRKAT